MRFLHCVKKQFPLFHITILTPEIPLFLISGSMSEIQNNGNSARCNVPQVRVLSCPFSSDGTRQTFANGFGGRIACYDKRTFA